MVEPQRWFVLNSGPRPPAFNMALDEALLEAVARLGRPVLRFYGWTLPAASFGYFQKIADVERLTPLRPLVRRPTGGGVVPHDADWTYSVIVPPEHDWFELRAPASYRRMHEWIRAAFARLGVPAELATEARVAAPGECFAGWERFDLLWCGRKIAGAAQRRTRAGLLIQGSVQPPPLGLSRADWEEAMRTAAHAQWAELQMTPALGARAEQLAAEKYSGDAWTRRR
jgi:lipoate-protein ligase A